MEIENNVQKRQFFNAFAVETCFTLIMAASNMISAFGEVYFIIHSLANGLSKTWILNNIEIFTAAGYLFAGSIMDFFGRKVFITLVFVSLTLPWLIITFPKNIYLLILALSMHQIAAGMSCCANIYIAEITTSKHRAPMIAVLSAARYIGGFLGHQFLRHQIDATIALPIFSIVCSCLIYYLPESPIWLYSRGKYQESIDALTKLRCANKDQVATELDEIKEFCGAQQITFNLCVLEKECLKVWKNFIFVAILVLLLRSTGYTILFEYAEDLKDNDENRLIDTKIIFALYTMGGLNGVLVAPYLVRFINVNVVLSIASFGMGTCVLMFNVFRDLTWIFGGLYLILGISGTVPMLPILAAEIFPQKVNGILNGLIGSLNYLFAWLLYKILRDPEQRNITDNRTLMWTFCISCFGLCVFAVYVLPKTARRSLNEIQNLYFRNFG